MRGAALRNYLLSLTALTDIIGEEKVFPMILPQRREWPAVLYGRTRFTHEECLEEDGGICVDAGETEFDIYCCSPNADDADRMAEIINGYKDNPALDGYRGEMSCDGRTYNVLARVTDWRDEVVAPVQDEPVWLARPVLTVTLTFEEQ